MDLDENNENKKNKLTIPKFDYSVTFAFIALLMVSFVLITDTNIIAWKLSSYK